jgi:phosphoglycolate phosphatase
MNLKKYKHIIWDWNGTLVDDNRVCVEILNKMLKKRSMPGVTEEQYRRHFDFPVEDYYRKVGFDFAAESYAAIADEFIAEYTTRQFECRLQENALEVLSQLSQKGLSQSILSAYHQSRLEEVVDFFGAGRFFLKISGLSDYYACSKLENGKKLVAELGFDAKDVLLIGDTTHDFQVADCIGTDCLLIADGHQDREKLESCGAGVLGSLNDVLSLLE